MTCTLTLHLWSYFDECDNHDRRGRGQTAAQLTLVRQRGAPAHPARPSQAVTARGPPLCRMGSPPGRRHRLPPPQMAPARAQLVGRSHLFALPPCMLFAGTGAVKMSAPLLLTLRHVRIIVAAATPARRAAGDDDGVEVQLQDLVALLERDPRYAKGPLLYQLLEAEGL